MLEVVFHSVECVCVCSPNRACSHGVLTHLRPVEPQSGLRAPSMDKKTSRTWTTATLRKLTPLWLQNGGPPFWFVQENKWFLRSHFRVLQQVKRNNNISTPKIIKTVLKPMKNHNFGSPFPLPFPWSPPGPPWPPGLSR